MAISIVPTVACVILGVMLRQCKQTCGSKRAGGER